VPAADSRGELRGELISLFCGAGGLDLGFEQARFRIGAAIDLRGFSIKSYNHNRKHRSGHVASVIGLGPKQLDKLAGRTLAPVGVIGGPPCQSFSRATHSSEDDHRHELPLEFARILKAFNRRAPVSFFAFENVPGLLKEKHALRYRRILKAFHDAGFEVTPHELNASSFGVAQNRPRLILVGFNRKLYPGLKWTPPEAERTTPVTVKAKIRGLPAPAYWTRHLDATTIPHHPNHWCMTPKSPNFTTAGALVQGTARGRSFRTLHWDHPSPTIAYGHREVHVHPDGHRRLSVHEAMLLQGFPPKYQLLGTLSDQITQVSEAVPPPLARAIAKSIQASIATYLAAPAARKRTG